MPWKFVLHCGILMLYSRYNQHGTDRSYIYERKREEGDWSWHAFNYLMMLLFRWWLCHKYTVQ